MALLLVAFAEGKSTKLACAAAGIDRMTAWRWCKQYPIEEAAKFETRARASVALQRLAANIDRSVDVVISRTNGERPEDGETARQQLQAAKITLDLVRSVLESDAARNSPRAGVPANATQSVPDPQAAREAAARLAMGRKP